MPQRISRFMNNSSLGLPAQIAEGEEKPLSRMAEAHGNRTHPRYRNRHRTTVLKTAEGTSPRALPGGF